MAIARQSLTHGTATSTSPLTYSTTVSTGSDLILLVLVHSERSTATISAVSWNGTACTRLVTVAASAWGKTEIWYLKNPTPGTGNTSVTFSGNLGSNVNASTLVFTGVEQTTTFRTAQSAAADSGTATSTLTVPSVVSGDYVLDALTIDSTGHSAVPGADQTEEYDLGMVGSDRVHSSQPGSSGGVMTYTWTTSAPYAYVATALIAAGGAQTVAVGLNTETDTALAMVASKPIFTAVGLNTETDTALSIVASKPIIAAIGLISETDTALGMTASKPIFQAVGLATEADEALALVFGQAVAVGLVTETDAALAIAAVKPIVQAVGLATEADTALSVVVPSVAVASGRIVLHLRFGPYN